MKDWIVAVDLGGTNIRAALCDQNAEILRHTFVPTSAQQGPDVVFARIVDAIRQVVSDWSRVRGIGLGAPGPLDPWRGVVLEAPNLPGMIDFSMKTRLEAVFPAPVFVGNDANIAALGEHRYGAGRGVAHMVYITISTGIGGGIIADGRLFLGWRGFAGEVGHITLDVNGPRCNCGNIGCLEVLAAGPAIARSAREALQTGRDSALQVIVGDDLTRLDAAMVAQAARGGDVLAREIFQRAARYIGLGLVSLLHVLDTELFVLGGGVAIHAWDLLYPTMTQILGQYAMPSLRKSVRVVPAQLGDDVGLIGAVALVLDNEPMSQ